MSKKTLLREFAEGGTGRYLALNPTNDNTGSSDWYNVYMETGGIPPAYVEYAKSLSEPVESYRLRADPYWQPPKEVYTHVPMVYLPEYYERMGGSVVNPSAYKMRQRYAESAFRDDLTSRAGAIGRYQIMPDTMKEYVDRTGKRGDLFDPMYNEAIRDWYMDKRLPQFEAVKRGNPSDFVREYRKYAAYNMGPGALNRALTKAQKAGVDIDNSTEWVKYLPRETREYVDFIVGGKDIQDTSRTTSAYEAALRANGLYANGGGIHIDPSKKGTFRAQATRMGMSVKDAASHILAHKENYSPEMVRKAVFAHNFAAEGGLLERYGKDKLLEAIKKRRTNTFDEGDQMYRVGSPYYTEQMPERSEVQVPLADPNMVISQEPVVVAPANTLNTMPVGNGRRTIPVVIPEKDLTLLQGIPQTVAQRDNRSVHMGDMAPIVEEAGVLPAETRIAESKILGENTNRTIDKMVGELRSGDELKEFQKELFRKGYYKNLPTPKITASTKEEVMSLQRMLKNAGYDLGEYGENKDGVDGRIGAKTRAAWEKYTKEHPDEAMLETVADGKIGSATRAAARAYFNDAKKAVERSEAEQDVVIEPTVDVSPEVMQIAAEKRKIEPIVPVSPESETLLSFPEYMYASGQIGTLRRAGNVLSAMRNYANGIINPHGHNATMSEGARRQMVGASLAHYDKTGKYGITDVEHEALGGMEGHSGIEFRKDTGKRGYLEQLADAPYHNIYGQSGYTYNDETGEFSPGPDAYTFNNVWDGNKVIEVKDDGAGDGSMLDAWREFVRARESGASIKASMESAASIRGTDVKPRRGKANTVDQKQLEKYYKEYMEYLSDEKKREKFNRAYEKNRGKN